MRNYGYVKECTPPAPFVYVTVGDVDGKIQQHIPALVDSAADRTLLPVEIAERMGLPIKPNLI